ncbi:MAG: FCD domain-containing protein [Armatimonadota bacterium]|nr:FCD domain-containing protein [Armatimonadota bacterium]
MDLHLEPIQPVRLKKQAVRQIRRLIEEGTLRPGDRLPGERQLSARFQISRGTVREALQLLEAIGLLEIRQGEGAFVRASVADADRLRLEWRDWVLRHRDRVREMLEVREGLEALAAELAAARRGSAGLAQMAAALDQMTAGSAGPDIALLVDADLLFHDGLLRAAENGVLRDLATTLGRELVPERAAVFDTPGRPDRSVAEHREIYAAVRAGDAHSAAAAAREHIASVRRDIERHVLDAKRREPRGDHHDRPAPGSQDV